MYLKMWYELKRTLLEEIKGEKFEVGGADNAAKMLILMSKIETDEVIEEKEGE